MTQLGTEESGDTVDFLGSSPHYAVVVKFEPIAKSWSFNSINRSGDWEVAVPFVSSDSGETIDMTLTCHQSESAHRLEIGSGGGGGLLGLSLLRSSLKLVS